MVFGGGVAMIENVSFSLKIGTDDFRDLISIDGLTVLSGRGFVDKALFIKRFLETSATVLLITRPRRWGKSLALSMLRYFLEKEVDGKPTEGLFQGLKISEYITSGSILEQYQAKYPVVLVGFKNVKTGTLEEIKGKIANNLRTLFLGYKYLLDNPEIKEEHKKDFEDILFERAANAKLQSSLFLLSEMLFKYHGKKVFILIDEYDNPINNNYENPEALKWLADFFGTLFGSCLKGNPYLEKGLVTGVLRIAKAEIFSGLNNIIEESILDNLFAEDYGFTENETFELIGKSKIKDVDFDEVRRWYNGYTVGKFKMYNPWSVVQYILKNELDTYWIDSGSRDMFCKVFIDNSKSSERVKVGQLLRQEELSLENKSRFDETKTIKKSISMDDVFWNPNAIWSLMIHSGYLTISRPKNLDFVKIPNYEIRQIVQGYVSNWLKDHSMLSKMANTILHGQLELFRESLGEALDNPAYSSRIFNNKATSAIYNFGIREFMYQFIVMAQLACINDSDILCEAFSEPENISDGRTRPDFLVLNKKLNLCVVCEIKVALKNESLTDSAKRALAQIYSNNYGAKYKQEGFKMIRLGLAFHKLDFEMVWDE